MPAIKQTITESEYLIMKILWNSEKAMTVSDVYGQLEGKEWTSSTVSTLLQRLAGKNIIGFDKKGKTHYYYPLMKKEEYSVNETKSLISKLYDGSLKNLVASLYNNKAVTKEEIDDLKKMFELEQ